MRTTNWLVLLASLIICCGSFMALTSSGTAQETGPQRLVTRELGSMAKTAAPVELGTKQLTVNIALSKDAGTQIQAALAPTSNTQLVLTVGGIEFDKTPEVHYQLYADLPTRQKPDYKNPYFVGNLDFFSLQLHETQPEHRAAAASFDLKRTIRELKSRKLWNDKKLSVTFVMTWLEDRNGHQLPVPPGVRARFSTLTISAVTPELSTPKIVGAPR